MGRLGELRERTTDQEVRTMIYKVTHSFTGQTICNGSLSEKEGRGISIEQGIEKVDNSNE